MCNFYKIINIDLNKLYNNNEINNKLIIEMLDINKKKLETKINRNLKNPLIKEFIIKELDNNKTKIKILLNCILNNLDINIAKINLRLIKNDNIKYYKYIDF